MSTDSGHIPVLLTEVLAHLAPVASGRYIDGTAGGGGHTAALLAASAPDGQVLALDRDPEAVAFTQQQLAKFGNRAKVVQANYADMATVAPAHGFAAINGILLDLGLSSRQLADNQRGFSFQEEGPLDMRFDPTSGQPASSLVNSLSADELANIFWQYGEEKLSRHYARLIVANRPLRTTTELATLLANNTRQHGRIHPATRVFQALRIAVNNELEIVEQGLAAAVSLLRQGGRLTVISFHSLEDRLVKQFMRRLSQPPDPTEVGWVMHDAWQPTMTLVTRKVVMAGAEEIAANPRSRSARLRVAEKL